ncbi:MAG TPA: PPOX class F420-dependent oxidoreductase [Acidimicrobiales bacterium]
MLDDATRELARGATIAAVTTLLPDGTPMTQPLWVDTDGEVLLLNTETGRQKYRNVRRDPRVTVTLWDPADPYRYSEVRGRVVETVTGPEARDHIDALSRKYTGSDYANPIGTERVILKVRPERRSGNV